MFENHNDNETNTNESEYVPEEKTSGNKYNRKINAARLAATLICAGVLGIGAVCGIKYYEKNSKDENLLTESEERSISEDTSDDSSGLSAEDDYKASNLSYLSKSSDALTTQEIYKKCLPSSVGITSNFEIQVASGGYFGYSRGTTTKQAVGTGTGIIMSEDGYIITNAHVIYESQYKAKAEKVTVLLSDQTELDAEIVGYDVQADVALLKADTQGRTLTPAEFGNSDETCVGDVAVAIGNPLGFDLFGTMTVGYISGLKREISVDTETIPLIQTDAAINSGNSGGPLINDKGQVIGINSSKLSSNYSSSQAAIEGLGFAIPINEALEIVDYIKTGEDGSQTVRKIQLGVTCREVSASSSQYYAEDAQADVYGLLVTDIISDGPADKAGVQIGDVIVGADGEAVQTFNEFNAVKGKKKAGDTLKLTIIRERKYYTIDVVLEEMEVSEEEPESEETVQDPEQQIPQEEPYEEPQQTPDQGGGYGGFFDPFGFDPFEDFFGGMFP